MDPELRAVVEEIRGHVDASTADTHRRFDAVDAGLVDTRRHFDAVDAGLADTRRRFDAVDAGLADTRRHFDAVDAGLADTRRRFDAVDAGLADTRRHFDVVAEGLRADIRLVAEGVTGLSERVDRVEVNLRDEILRSRHEFSAMLRVSHAELDRRIQTLERRADDLGPR